MDQPHLQSENWPDLPYEAWKDTCATLHMYTQIVGKIRMSYTPWLNHSWHVTLYLTVRGLTTSPIPYDGRAFQIDFDFIDHAVFLRTSEGREKKIPLNGLSVAEFYSAVLSALGELRINVRINEIPNEVPDPIPFSHNRAPATYDPDSAHRFWKAMLQIDRIFNLFRTRFLGKCSPVHFFWGSFDLAVTRFSGRPAPKHPGGVPGPSGFRDA